MSPGASETQLIEFYLHGFRRALARYRTFVILGWGITALGGIGLFGSCHGMDRGDLLIVAIPLVTIAAGVITVHLSITGIEAYVTIPFPLPGEGEVDESVRQRLVACEALMKDVEAGGWQEAFEAIGTLESIERQEEEENRQREKKRP